MKLMAKKTTMLAIFSSTFSFADSLPVITEFNVIELVLRSFHEGIE